MAGFMGKRWFKRNKNEINRDEPNNIVEDESQESQESTAGFFKTHLKKIVISSAVAVAVAAIAFVGNDYVKSNMNEVYHVMINDQEVGVVSDPVVVDQFIEERKAELVEEYPEVQMVLMDNTVTIGAERAFKAKSDDTAAVEQLRELVPVQAYGVELVVNGEVVAIVKDEEEAQAVLERLKDKYLPEAQEVALLSVDDDVDVASKASPTQLVSIEFEEEVNYNTIEIDATQVMNTDEVVKKLETGDIQPVKYVVEEGDCVSCIAQKFDITSDVIYQNNEWIENDFINVGDELDLTVLQPTISVRTSEKLVENVEIQHNIEYVNDDSMKVGQTEVITPGKNGVKQVTFMIHKVNGMRDMEELVDEEVVVEPITAVVKKGTKVIKGEGTGKFAWPVVSARVTSGYGTRNGRMHKGIDMTGNSQILAADHGKVTFAGYKNGYGNTVIIDHNNGYETLYAHTSKVYVSKGQLVEKGEEIAKMGNTGDSQGVHLHFEVRKDGSLENPSKYLSR